MTIFRAGDIVKAPFPHIERPVVVPRPALVVSAAPLGPDGLLIWALMITNATREDWPGDVAIADWDAVGLIVPSKVRTAKISTIEAARASLLGRLSVAAFAEVKEILRDMIA